MKPGCRCSVRDVSSSGVVTPEGVFLDYRPAGLATRTMGRLIDLGLQVALTYFVLTVALVVVVSVSATPWIIFATVFMFVMFFGYPVLFEVYGGGRTPGHRATGTRVIRTDGGPVRFRHALIRSFLFLVDGFATSGFAGAVAVLTTKRGQRLGDLAAGTMVVRLEGVAAVQKEAHVVPSGLLDRSKAFDLRRLDPADVTTARILLDRGGSFHRGAQLDLATRLATRLDDQLGGVMIDGDAPSEFVAVVVQAHVRGPTVGESALDAKTPSPAPPTEEHPADAVGGAPTEPDLVADVDPDDQSGRDIAGGGGFVPPG